MPDTTIAEAQSALGQLGTFARAIKNAEKIVDALANAEQVGKELDAANQRKREALAADVSQEIEAARAEGARQRDALISEAQATVANNAAASTARVAEADRQVEAAKAELDRLNAEIAATRQRFAAVLAS